MVKWSYRCSQTLRFMLGKRGRNLLPPFSAPSLFSYNELHKVPFREDDRLHLLIWQYRGRTQPEAVEVSPLDAPSLEVPRLRRTSDNYSGSTGRLSNARWRKDGM
jgi:hypothetical protein